MSTCRTKQISKALPKVISTTYQRGTFCALSVNESKVHMLEWYNNLKNFVQEVQDISEKLNDSKQMKQFEATIIFQFFFMS